MKYVFILLAVIVVFFSSCKKEENAKDVWVRIENTSTNPIEFVSIGNVDYGNINPSSTSDYKIISEKIYSAFCNFKIANEIKYAGYFFCGTPSPAAFEPGYYTFKILPSLNGFYGITVNKE